MQPFTLPDRAKTLADEASKALGVSVAILAHQSEMAHSEFAQRDQRQYISVHIGNEINRFETAQDESLEIAFTRASAFILGKIFPHQPETANSV